MLDHKNFYMYRIFVTFLCYLMGKYIVAALSVRLFEPAFGTYGFIFCMKTVGKLTKRFFRG